MNTTTHTFHCINNAQTAVREEFASRLMAPPWEDEAIAAENVWVEATAAEWLIDGTITCYCN